MSCLFGSVLYVQGSGFVPPTPDHVFALTYVDSWGNIKKIDRSHPDFAVIVSCAGMCGIILDVTAKVYTAEWVDRIK